MNTKYKLIFVLVLVFGLSVVSSGKHKYHTSFTRIDYNTQAKTLEFTIKVFSHDLLPVLETRFGKRIDLEKTPDIDSKLLDYLNEKIILETNGGRIGKLKWVGKEWESEVLYFYVELPFDGNFEETTLKNNLFFEQFNEQVNLVTIHFGEKKSDFIFKAGIEKKVIKFNEEKRGK